MNSKDLQPVAAVGQSDAARITGRVIDVWFHTASVSLLQMIDAGPDADYFNSQLVSGDPGITKKGHFTQISTEVGPANSHPMNPYLSFSGFGWLRIRNYY